MREISGTARRARRISARAAARAACAEPRVLLRRVCRIVAAPSARRRTTRMEVADQLRRAKRRLRVIVVAYHYHPDPAVGSLRARNVAQALARVGHDVHVVSTAMPGVAADSYDGPVRVWRVHPWPSPRDLLTRLRRLIPRLHRPTESRAAPGHGDTWKAPTRVSALRRWLGALIRLPDDRQGFIAPAVRAASTLMRD